MDTDPGSQMRPPDSLRSRRCSIRAPAVIWRTAAWRPDGTAWRWAEAADPSRRGSASVSARPDGSSSPTSIPGFWRRSASESRSTAPRHHPRPVARAGLRSHSRRMVLMHLPERDEVLPPGGRAQTGRVARLRRVRPLSTTSRPAVCPGEVPLKTHDAMGRLHMIRESHRSTADSSGPLARTGPRSSSARKRTSSSCSRDRGARCCGRATNDVRRAMIDAGYVTEEEFDPDVARMEDADFRMPSPIMWTAWGRRP